MPVNFKINLFTGFKSNLLYASLDNSGTLTIGDEIQILEFVGAQTVGNSRIAWKINYNGPLNPNATPVIPGIGNKF